MKQKQHCSELTVMSGIAILFVLGIHGCGSALKTFCLDTMNYADADLLLRVLSNIVSPAVPMFLFISGYKYALNDLQTPYVLFLKKRLPRVIMSFLIINTLFWTLDSIVYMESFDPILLIKTYISSCMGYSVAYQLWYIPMYCFVVVACPLLRRMIPATNVRFVLLAAIGIIQRVFEIRIPILARYPIRFISYPVFFEMGVMAHESDWKHKLTNAQSTLLVWIYAGIIVLLSWLFPQWSTNRMVGYTFYYFAGTAAMFVASIHWRGSRILRWMGTISYPVFLLHEPLIGRMIGAQLRRVESLTMIQHAALWIVFDLCVTYLLARLIMKMRAERFLWNFRI